MNHFSVSAGMSQDCSDFFLIKYEYLIATFMLHPSVERKAFYRQEAVLVGCKVGALHELEKRVFSHCLKTLNIRNEIR